MDRLTFEGDFCDIAQCLEMRGGNHCPDGYCSQRRVWERLKEYEDTGLEPMEIESALDGATREFMAYDKLGPIDRLRELVQAEQNGRLVVLPCKVGDQLWYYPKWYARSGYEPEPLFVEEVNSYSGVITVMCYMDPDTKIEAIVGDFGKTVFLTKEEAKASMEKGDCKDGSNS